MSTDAIPTQPANPRPAGNYGWILYFAFLVAASVGVTVWMILFNLSIQLTPEQVEAAQAKWKENGPKDYKLFYTERIDDDLKPINYAVTVTDHTITDARKNGSAIEPNAVLTMPGLLAKVANTLQEDRKPEAPRVYTIARFDAKTGAMLYYVRRVMGTKERIELDVKTDWLEK